MRRAKRKRLSRRQFLHKAAGSVAAFTIVPRHVLGAGKTPPSDKLNIACIGVGGRGGSNVNGVRGENIVALCDVDMQRWRFEKQSKGQTIPGFSQDAG